MQLRLTLTARRLALLGAARDRERPAEPLEELGVRAFPAGASEPEEPPATGVDEHR